jgi:hypothetical protein
LGYPHLHEAEKYRQVRRGAAATWRPNAVAESTTCLDECRALTQAAGQSSGGGPGDRIDAEADLRSVSTTPGWRLVCSLVGGRAPSSR